MKRLDSNWFAQVSAFTLCGILCLFIVIMNIREFVGVYRYSTSNHIDAEFFPFPSGRYSQDDLRKTITFRGIRHEEWFEGAIPQQGDTLVMINDTAATLDKIFGTSSSYFFTPRKDIRSFTMDFLHDGELKHTKVSFSTPPFGESLFLWVARFFRFAASLSCVWIGLWALFKNRKSAMFRVLALFSFSLGLHLLTSTWYEASSFKKLDFPLPPLSWSMALATLFPGFWLHLALIFPTPLEFVKRRPWATYALIYLPLIAMTVYYQRWISPPSVASFAWGFTLFVFAGFLIAIGRMRTETHTFLRSQIRLVLWAAIPGLMLFILHPFAMASSALEYLFTFFHVNSRFANWTILTVASTVMGVAPIGLFMAMRRFRLLDIEGKLQRSLIFVGTTGLVVLVAGVIGYTIVVVLTQVTGTNSITLPIVVTLTLAAGVSPLQVRLRNWLESKLYPERERIRVLSEEFLGKAVTIADQHEFWSAVCKALGNAFDTRAYHSIGVAAQVANQDVSVEQPPLTKGSAFSNLIRLDPSPVLVDEILSGQKSILEPAEVKWFMEREVEVIVPLPSTDGTLGYIAVGSKPNREQYTSEELRVLKRFARQIGVAAENIHLIEENVAKKQMEIQLEAARRIQQGFLPTKMPETVGLQIAAFSKSCLECAGDYYDVIPLKDGRTVIALGDVSGKGAGAAMLMANLQAALRTVVQTDNSIARLVTDINEVIVHNSPGEEYITFFVGIFNPADHSFTYVNAGHLGPIVLRQDGTTEVLEAGGLILGAFSGISYEQAAIKLSAGDQIMLFSDGITEAMNQKDEEYGEDSISRVMQACDRNDPEGLIAKLIKDVQEFHQSDHFDDDLTALVACVQ